MHGGDIYRNNVELDFSVNINPLGMPESVKQVLRETVEISHRYPDIQYDELKYAIHTVTGVGKRSILCGNGASELFMAIMHAVSCVHSEGCRTSKANKRILLPVPSFLGYERVAKACHMDTAYYEMKREDGFALTRNFLTCLTEDINLLILANPNNPTGKCISQELLEDIIRISEKKGIIVILDECFIGFTNQCEEHSFLRKITEYSNLIVVRSFTKIFAMAGVRLGYLVCSGHRLINSIEEQLPEWNVSVFAQRAGVVAVKEREYLKQSRELVRTEREYLTKELGKTGIRVHSSDVNYLLIYTKYPLYEELLKRKILIRDCCNYRGMEKGYYRIAVKTPEENRRLVREIGACYEA